MIKFLDKEHYAYLKSGTSTIGNYQDGYDVDTLDYKTFNSLDEVASHFKNRNQFENGVYFKMTPLKFNVTVEVKE